MGCMAGFMVEKITMCEKDGPRDRVTEEMVIRLIKLCQPLFIWVSAEILMSQARRIQGSRLTLQGGG